MVYRIIMKKLDLTDLNKKTIKELVKLRSDMKKELFEMRFKHSLRAIKETHLLKVARKNVARINTVLHTKIAN